MVDAEIRWMSTAEAASYLGIGSRTLYRLVAGGDLTVHRFGRVIRLTRDEVDGYVKRARITPGTLAHLYPGPVVDELETAP